MKLDGNRFDNLHIITLSNCGVVVVAVAPQCEHCASSLTNYLNMIIVYQTRFQPFSFQGERSESERTVHLITSILPQCNGTKLSGLINEADDGLVHCCI